MHRMKRSLQRQQYLVKSHWMWYWCLEFGSIFLLSNNNNNNINFYNIYKWYCFKTAGVICRSVLSSKLVDLKGWYCPSLSINSEIPVIISMSAVNFWGIEASPQILLQRKLVYHSLLLFIYLCMYSPKPRLSSF